MYKIRIVGTAKYYKYCMKGIPRFGTTGKALEFVKLAEAKTVLSHLRVLLPTTQLDLWEY